MKHRPWPIVILAIIHLLAPITNLLGSAFIMKMGVGEYLRLFYQDSGLWGMFELFALFPIAAVAIYLVRPWSYPVFLSIMVWQFISNVQTWREFPDMFGLPLFLLTTVINIGFVSYFLIPAVRSFYFNRRLRWWETKPRYIVHYEGTLNTEGQDIECKIEDLSVGGAYIKVKHSTLTEAAPAKLEFTTDGKHYTFNASVAYRLLNDNDTLAGYGLEFMLNKTQKKNLASLVKTFKKSQRRNRNEPMDLANFKKWVKQVVSSAKSK